ncbi:putative ribonuclease H-like domain-containing protein [Tanacetum coccineum]
MALMAFSDSKVYNDKTCSKTCLKNYETLKKQCDDLIVKLNQTEFIAATYKRGLATVKEQLITYRKNEVLFSEEVAVLKREVACKDYEINVLKSEFEKVKQEKEGIEFKIKKFDKASKDLDKLLGSQITDKSKKGLGYNVVPPPHPLIYNRPKKLDLSYSGLDEFKEPKFKSYSSEDSKQESNIVCDKKLDDSKENSDDSLVKEQVSKDTSSFVESPLNVDKETVFLVDKKIGFVKPKNHEKPIKKSVRYAEMYRSHSPRGIKETGMDRSSLTHLNAQRNMVPRAVLMKTGLKTFNTARTVNTAHPKSTVYSAKPMSCFSKSAQSTVKRPYQSKTVLTNKKFTQKVNTVKAQAVNTARPKVVKIARPSSAVVNAVRGKPQQDDTGFVDRAYGGRISGKGTLKTDSLDFEDVYFVNELKFNLFSVSQMCDKKNYVLFTDTECLVLSPNFKLLDESQMLLKIPRKDNIYSFDIKNIVLKESLTCLVAKATLDESMLWHRRLGHINFKNINKLVKDNLVRGLPTKCFENDQTCVACLKGKQHKASYKSKVLNPITKPLFMLHMDLFGPTLVSSLMHKKYCLVATDDYKREKGIKREYSVAITPQQNGVVKRRNRILIEAARTMLADSKLPTTFWAKAVSTACYVKSKLMAKVDEEFLVGFSLSNSPKDMFKMGASHTLKATHAEFFSDEDKPKVNLGNILNSYTVLTTPNTRIHKDHPITNVIGDVKSYIQIRRMTKPTSEQGFLSAIQPTSIAKALSDSSWVEAMQEELLQLKLQQIWILVDLPIRKRAIGTKRVFRNKKDERGIVIRNKSAFLYGTIEERVYVTQPLGFKDPDHPEKVYNVIKELCTAFEKLMKDKFQMITFFLGLQVQQREEGIFISQDKYVAEILKKFNYTDVKSASTTVDLEKPLVKDGDIDDVYVHLYRSMIGSLMYLIASRPDIRFVVCACARFQVTPKTSHLLAVKRIFKYLKGKPTLGLWYSRDSPFELVAYTDRDYAGATQDRKSTTRGCQFLGNRLISWQCKKQTVVATSTTEAEYVAAASCCGQVLWIQNQLLDYGYM